MSTKKLIVFTYFFPHLCLLYFQPRLICRLWRCCLYCCFRSHRISFRWESRVGAGAALGSTICHQAFREYLTLVVNHLPHPSTFRLLHPSAFLRFPPPPLSNLSLKQTKMAVWRLDRRSGANKGASWSVAVATGDLLHVT